MPAAVRALHAPARETRWVGRADVAHGTSRLVPLLIRLARLPPPGEDVPLVLTITPDGDTEIWTRRFATHVYASRQSAPSPGRLAERVGMVILTVRLVGGEGGLAYALEGASVIALPLPRALWPTIATLESERDGRYTFDIEARLPWSGRLIRYTGWLEPADDGDGDRAP